MRKLNKILRNISMFLIFTFIFTLNFSSLSVKAFQFSTINNNVHTMKIQPTGKMKTGANGAFISIDSLIVIDATGKEVIYEDNNPSLKFVGNWTVDNNALNSGGTAKYSNDVNAYVELTFTGKSIKWTGLKNPSKGVAKVTIDGVSSDIDIYSTTIAYKATMLEKILEVTETPVINHTIKIQPTGKMKTGANGAFISIDSLIVIDATGREVVYEDNNAALKFIGNWTVDNNALNSGGTAKYSNDVNAYVELTFTGKSIRWTGLKNRSKGIAKVTIDGVSSDLDTYSATIAYKATMLEKILEVNETPVINHTIKIQPTGKMKTGANGAFISIDSLIVIDATGREVVYEDNNPALKFIGNWTVDNNALNSGGTAKYSNDVNAYVELTFTGKSIKWTGLKNRSKGIAKVTIDGVSSDLDTYSTTIAYKATMLEKVLEVTETPVINHTIKIQPTGKMKTGANGAFISIDSLIVIDATGKEVIYEDNNPALKFIGNWTVDNNALNSGGTAKYSNDVNAYVELIFTGKSIKWTGLKNRSKGIAKVTIDGISSEVDTYSSTIAYKATMLEKAMQVANVLNVITYSVNSDVKVGQEFKIYVKANNIKDLYAASMDFKYNPEMLEILDIKSGAIFNNIIKNSYVFNKINENNSGVATMGALFLGAVKGEDVNGAIFIIKAKAKKVGNLELKTTNTMDKILNNESNMCIKLLNSNDENNTIGYTFEDLSIKVN